MYAKLFSTLKIVWDGFCILISFLLLLSAAYHAYKGEYDIATYQLLIVILFEVMGNK